MSKEKLFNELLKRHAALMRHVIRRYFPNKMDSDDVYQDLTIHIYSKLQEAPNDELEKWLQAAWITTITRNKCLDFLKAQARLSEKMKHSDDQEYFNHITAQSAVDKAKENQKELLKISVRKLIITLKPKERAIVIMRFIKGYSMQEIAEMMDLSNASVYLKRALNKIKEHINGKDFFELFDGFEFLDEMDLDKVDAEKSLKP